MVSAFQGAYNTRPPMGINMLTPKAVYALYITSGEIKLLPDDGILYRTPSMFSVMVLYC